MSKQQPKQAAQARKASSPSGFSTGGFLLRNLAVAAGIALLLFTIDSMNEKERNKQVQFGEMYKEFMQLQQTGGSRQRMEDLRNQLIEMQNDTGGRWLKSRTTGYYFAVHDVAIGGMKNVEEAKERAGKTLTREDKFAMRVGIWPLINYINKNTPENAVVLLPDGHGPISNDGKWNYIYDPEWMEYFLYPRLCVSMGSKEQHPDLAKRATHVVIVEGKGYEELKYDVPVEQRVQEAVLPIDHPPVQKQN